MMTEETARRIADALERIADRLEPRAGGMARLATLMPGERVFSAPSHGGHTPGGVTTVYLRPIVEGAGGGA